MARYNPDSPFADAESQPAPAEAAEAAEEAQTAVLPKSILAGKEFSVGDKVILEITAIHDGEVQVAYYEPEAEEEETEGPASESAPMMEGEGMAAMME